MSVCAKTGIRGGSEEIEMNSCNYPGCNRVSSRRWALVPLCESHYTKIQSETNFYYNATSTRMKYSDRTYYLKIAQLIPWSQVSLGREVE